MKSYLELISIPDFKDRYEYLKCTGRVGEETFGSKRYLNQLLYRTPEWKRIRRQVILRDEACDLGHPDFSLGDAPAYIHHINPITMEDIIEMRPCVYDLNNLITTSFNTHQAIHFGDASKLILPPVERKPNDTCPWRD